MYIKSKVRGGITISGLFFHGTNRACTLGDKRTNDELCSKKECSLCAIIRDSFDIDKTGKRFYGFICIFRFMAETIPTGTKNSFSRFGPGIYTSACSSSKSLFPFLFSNERTTDYTIEADDYFNTTISPSKVQSRAILVNTVVYGKPCKLYHNDTYAGSSFRSGFHSVSTVELCIHAIWLTTMDCLRAGDGSPWMRSQLR